MIKYRSFCRAIVCLWILIGDTAAQYYQAPEDVFNAPVSGYFGFNTGYQPKNTKTRYRVMAPAGDNTDDLTQAWFDVCNNNISCSIDANGLVEYPSVMGPLSDHQKVQAVDAQDAYGPGDYITGSQWTFSIDDGSRSALLSELEDPSLDIVDNLFYKWSYRFDQLVIQMLAFAPEGAEDPLVREPRALILTLHIKNTGNSPVNGKISVPPFAGNAADLDPSLPKAQVYGPAPLPVADSHHGNRANFHPRYAEVAPTVAGYEAVLLLGGAAWDPAFPDVSFSLDPGASTCLSFAFLVGASVPELEYTRDFLLSRSVLEWMNSTAGLHKKATGTLIIPEDPMLAEMFYRYYECGHTCYLLNGSGSLTEPKGGSWSIMSILNPAYVIGSINNLEYLEGMIPNYASSAKSNVSFSLYGTTLILIMAADYYQRTGNTDFIGNPVFREYATTVIGSILSTRYPEATLFPSKNIWDGPSRGDYHTGSQIIVWRVLDAYSRVAREEWKDTATAGYWSRKAEACREDIFTRCVIPGPFGPQFAEGTWKNGAVDKAAKCHDGEEVALVQSAFYGLAEQDDPLVINHCRASMTPFNYLYSPRLNAMLWQSDSYWDGGYTFPAWLVVIAGAENKETMLAGIRLWETMTDVDGSPWWWPYDVGQTDPSVVNRRRCNFVGGFCDVAKVSYATSVFNTLLINNVIGLSADVPGKTVSFRPFSPWPAFEWDGGHIGNAFFDIKYTDDGSAITAQITNRNLETYLAHIGITAPEGKRFTGNGSTDRRYGREYLEVEKLLNPGQTGSFTLSYEEGPNTGIAPRSAVNYPNPFNDRTSIILEPQIPGSKLTVQVNIFDMTGQMVRSIKTDLQATEKVLPEVTWNGCDEGGHKVCMGIYPYSVTVTRDNGKITLDSGCMVIL